MGAVVCECCKNDTLRGIVRICPLCRHEVAKSDVKCQNCALPCAEILAAGWRTGWLGHLIGEYKMQSVRAAKSVLVEVLDTAVTQSSMIGNNIVVIPLPTIRRHVRERGFDHTAVIAKNLAKRHGWKMVRILGRAKDSVQVGSSKSQRKIQAKNAYELLIDPDLDVKYLLVDDIWTTGASMLAAIEILTQAGVLKEQIFGTVIAVSK